MDEAFIAYINAVWESSEARGNGDKELIDVTLNTQDKALGVVLSHLRVSMGNDRLEESLVWRKEG